MTTQTIALIFITFSQLQPSNTLTFKSWMHPASFSSKEQCLETGEHYLAQAPKEKVQFECIEVKLK